MPQLHDESALIDIATQARLILMFTQGMDEASFRVDTLRQMAVLRALENIGESADCLSVPCRVKHPEIRWQSWISFRNSLMHAENTGDLERVWMTVTGDVCSLLGMVRALYKSETGMELKI